MNLDELERVFAWLKAQRYTGPVTFHLSQGRPSLTIEFPREPQRMTLDTTGQNVQSLTP